MRIAFLVLAHTNPEQVCQLAKLLKTDASDVYVHYDAKSKDDLTELNNCCTLVNRIPVYHGGFSQIESTLNLINAASIQKYDYFYLLSGQCFPIKPMSWLVSKLNLNKDYINIYPMPKDIYAKRLDRLQHYYFERGAENKFLNIANKLLKKLPKRDFVKGLSLWPYAGSQWWCLKYETIQFILNFIKRNPEFYQYMKTTAYADEVFFHSIISQMDFEQNVDKALFCADFDPLTNRPKIYTLDDVAMLDARPAFTARKFDSRVCHQLIDFYKNKMIG